MNGQVIRMKSILKAINSKPSTALRYMVIGLKRIRKQKNFNLKMVDYLYIKDEVCFGCVATCTMQVLAGVDITNNVTLENDGPILSKNRAKMFGVYETELKVFEQSIDEARAGRLLYLFEFCGAYSRYFGFSERKQYSREDWYLGSDDWEEQLPDVQKTIQELRLLGL